MNKRVTTDHPTTYAETVYLCGPPGTPERAMWERKIADLEAECESLRHVVETYAQHLFHTCDSDSCTCGLEEARR